jgi:DNA mismatch repair ATPase MutL
MKITKQPKVNQVNEFKEIANNFANPLEIVREAISNSIDARANEIHLLFDIINHFGEELFRVTIKDNGKGMDERELESFFDLGNSTKIDDSDQ